MFKKSIVFASLAAIIAGASLPAVAALRGDQLFDDQYLVNFDADPNNVYEIIGHKDLFTDFQMAPGEIIMEAYLSDKRPMFWRTIVSANQQHFMVKPMQTGLINTGTIITNKRTYQLRFAKTVETGQWHQRVTWNDGNEAVFRAANAATALNEAKAFPESTGAPVVKLANINADYTIDGSGSIRPISVMDDGTRTKITFSASLQNLPTILVKGADGKLTLAGWAINQEDNGTRSVTLGQLFTGAVLKLGDAKVEITNNRFPTR